MNAKLLSLIGLILFLAAFSSSCGRTAAPAAGPNGGDVVPIQNGSVKAEVLTSATTGEVMVHTWDPSFKHRLPIDPEPMSLGSGGQIVQLDPYPLATDPPGKCSRFYGQADWVRAGKFDSGWLQCCGSQGARHDFAWSHCWSGEHHDGMWSGMGEHRRGLGNAGGPMGPGMAGHR